MYVYPQLVQCNSMLAYAFPLCLGNACITARPKCPLGNDCRLSGSRLTQQVTTASYRLSLQSTLTAALVHYAKDKGAFAAAQ